MREEAFRRFLAQRLGARSVDSYLSNLRRVERELTIDLDACARDEHEIDTLRVALKRSGMSDSKVADCSSALRAYAAFADRAPGTRDVKAEPPLKPIAAQSDQIAIASLTTSNLLATYAAILRELRARGVARTGNGPVGDYAEHLFARALGWTLEPNSTAGFDARDPVTTLRYEIKARRLATGKRQAQLSALRRLPEHRFDILAVLLFAPDFSIDTAALIPHAMVLQHAAYTAHTNSWRVTVTPALLALPEVVDVTSAIAADENTINS
ncbi:hypothetical protein SAMN05216382_0264 [Sphingomonas palmae]|uniref:Uncharacterized protein n=1 Tax=Sphingomonas palmae TaxID=1855283 RepID=A0A1H7GHM5_9SPHN|nr:hypothetical protein [Sphingomonas palmae]SEK36432.1 hypothetical protein SAMN05216382_0264 [Sphingomonas palmae]